MKRLVVAIVVLAACGGHDHARAPESDTGRLVASNVLRGDYAGSKACEDCHQQIYEAWQSSAMRNMTRDAETAKIRAPFDGATLTVGEQTATMTMQNGARVVTVATPAGSTTYRVTKVVGGRYREDFVGTSGDGVERILPATYVFGTQSWRYKGYSVMVKERPELSVQAVWSQECIGCHNTLPLATTLYDELYGKGAPAYQGRLSDRLLPASRLWGASTRDADGLMAALATEISFLGGAQPIAHSVKASLAAASQASEEHLHGDKLVELGIGCEACHNGAKEHAATPEIRPTFAAQSDLFAIDPPPKQEGTRAQWINHTCAKCHTVLFSHYAYTWEGGSRTKNPGGSTINSGEGRDFQLGGCSSQMSCTTCHDPHTVDPKEKYEAMATPAGNKLCEGCHAAIAANPTAHSHHGATSAGNSCIGCHMPKKNMGLDYGLSRYHRIGSPNDPARTANDRPLECALCHADKSVESLASTMESWWPRTRVDRAALQKLYGADLSVNTMRATLQQGVAHEQAVALVTLGASGDKRLVRVMAPHLAHQYPLVRYFAKRALEQLLGTPVPIDVNLPADQVRAAVTAWLATLPR